MVIMCVRGGRGFGEGWGERRERIKHAWIYKGGGGQKRATGRVSASFSCFY